MLSDAFIKIRGRVIVPELEVVSNVIVLKNCFLQYAYTGEFIVKNTRELPFIYCVVKQVRTFKYDI